MGLENPSFINDLVDTNPVGPTDFRSEGDDHIRNMKKALRASFPGIAGRVWRKVARAANANLTITDNMVLQKCAGGITLTPDAAATLGNGWMTMVRADAGAVTLTPGQSINGAATLAVPNGYTAIIFSDGSEFFAYLVHHAVPATTPAFPAGTIMVFHQTAAPTSWTKLVNSQYDNAAMRSTIGAVGFGGADNFTATFGAGKVTAGHALIIAEMPSHGHGYEGVGYTFTGGAGGASADTQNNKTTGLTGGGAAHTHGLTNMNLKYVDIIVAQKD